MNRLGRPVNYLIVFILMSLTCYCFFPGLMSYDSIYQYAQVKGDTILTSSHPVIMAYTWMFLAHVYDNPGVLFIAFQLLYWVGIYFLAASLYERYASKIVFTVVFGLFPPLFIISLHVWKDVGMLVTLILGTAASIQFVKTKNLVFLAITILAFLYSMLIRDNSIIIVIPLFSIIIHKSYHLKKTCIMTIGLVLLWFGCQQLLNSKIQKNYTLGTILVWDLAAIAKETNTNVFPDYLVKGDEQQFLENVNANFNPYINVPVFTAVNFDPGESNRKDLLRHWLKTIVKHPKAYLKHRVEVFSQLFAIGKEKAFYTFNMGIQENTYGIGFKNLTSEQLTKVFNFFDKLSFLIFYKAWVYLILNVVLFIYTVIPIKRNDLQEYSYISALTSSGIATAGSLLIIAPAGDFRYIIWVIASALISLAIFLKILYLNHCKKQLNNSMHHLK